MAARSKNGIYDYNIHPREHDDEPSSSSSSNPPNTNTNMMNDQYKPTAAATALLNGGVAKAFSIRVIGAEDRIDPAGSVFTAYLIEVETNTNSNTNTINKRIVEHRYSEFAKLNRALEVNDVQLRSSFPTKVTLLGRIANWTPSLHFDPEKRHELVTYRKIKLDIWLVELAEKLVRGEIVCPELRDRVEEFLQQSSAFCPPCDRANAVDWSPLQVRTICNACTSSLVSCTCIAAAAES